jgi:hypothetical protein
MINCFSKGKKLGEFLRIFTSCPKNSVPFPRKKKISTEQFAHICFLAENEDQFLLDWNCAKGFRDRLKSLVTTNQDVTKTNKSMKFHGTK